MLHTSEKIIKHKVGLLNLALPKSFFAYSDIEA